MEKQIVDKIFDTLQELCDKIKEDYGVESIIAIGLKDGDTLIEGGAGSKELSYNTISKLLMGINGFYYQHFGDPDGCKHCKHD